MECDRRRGVPLLSTDRRSSCDRGVCAAAAAHLASFIRSRCMKRRVRGRCTTHVYCRPWMRQIVISRHGPPDVLVPRDSADPVPSAGDIRIAVRATGVNFADILARIGLYPDAPKPPVTVG